MAERSTTRLQISGQRFLTRRMAHALVRGDVRMLDDPLRCQSLSLAGGCVLAVIVIAVSAVLAFFAPRGRLGDAAIVMLRDSGAMYVRVGDTVHPVLNLASARLITGSAAAPHLVDAAAVDGVTRGPTLGIAGAPESIASPLAPNESGWTVCDDATSTTTAIAGTPAGSPPTDQSVLVSARGESAASTYLLFNGQRAKVDLRNPAVVRALKLEGVAPRQVSRALLDAVPEVAEITAPVIPRAGTAGPSVLHGFGVGTVVRVPRAESSEFFVILADGVQRIGEVAADLIRFTQSHGGREIAVVEPASIGAVPVVDDLAVAAFPDRGGVADDPVVCVQWRWSDETRSVSSVVYTTNSVPVGGSGSPVTLAQADAAGPQIDTVVLPAGRSAFVRAAGVGGAGAQTGPRYLVTDRGVVYGIGDDDAAERLGLTGTPVPAPWPLLTRLPRGPQLSVAAASVAR
ncbi:MAG TPA: type VII secretion protein EccB, partial [Mycobacterium sp.]|nr:type VII secretion protein EccB [Mycobacterium sp.]